MLPQLRERMAKLKADFVSGQGSLHELARAAGMQITDIAETVSLEDWYGARSAVQRGELPMPATDAQRLVRILAALEEVARQWAEESAGSPGKARPLELRAMVHVVRELSEVREALLGRAAAVELPPPRLLKATGSDGLNGHTRLSEDGDARYE